MKTIVFLLILLAVTIVAGQYLNANPLDFANKSARLATQQDNPNAAVSCSKKPISDITEGPYYKSGSPERKNIREGYNSGEPLTLKGTVMDENCNPIAGAWIDFWQANEKGDYDNNGFTLRGHQFTDTAGKYELQTIIPGEYTGRTLHIHVRLRAYEGGPVTTTQLFVPNRDRNQTDPLFDESLLIDIKDGTNGKEGTYNFVIKTQ